MATVTVCAECDHEWPCKHTPEAERWRYARPIPALVEGLAQLTGPAKAARTLKLAADAAERLK